MANALVPPSSPTHRINLTINVTKIMKDIIENPAKNVMYSTSRRELEIPFPEEFVRSTNRRFVNVISVRTVQLQREYRRAVWEEKNGENVRFTLDRINKDKIALDNWVEYLPDIYTLHCSFVHDEFNDERTVAWLNEPLTAPHRYEQFQTERSFRLWIENSADGTRVELDKLINVPYEIADLPFVCPPRKWGPKYYYNEYVVVVQLELEF